jgi:hypothetical protein
MRDWLKDAFASSPGWAWPVVGTIVLSALALPRKILPWIWPFQILDHDQRQNFTPIGL